MVFNGDGADPYTQILGIVVYNHRQRGKYAVDNIKRYQRHRERGIEAVEPSCFINKLEDDDQKCQQRKGYARVQAMMIENEDEYGKNNDYV